MKTDKTMEKVMVCPKTGREAKAFTSAAYEHLKGHGYIEKGTAPAPEPTPAPTPEPKQKKAQPTESDPFDKEA